MKITILAVGKIKESFYRDAVAEYKKRLGRYVRLEIMEFPDEKIPEHASRAEECRIKEKECARMAKYLQPDAYVAALAIEGTAPDSLQLAEQIRLLGVNGVSHMIFIIGGSLGLSEEILRRADLRLSFSRMTFPHQLMRVILLEQLYRSCRIISNEPYHK